jgi:hypothetical protein
VEVRETRALRSRQGQEASPPLEFAAELNIVLAGKCELTVLADAEDSQRRRNMSDVAGTVKS